MIIHGMCNVKTGCGRQMYDPARDEGERKREEDGKLRLEASRRMQALIRSTAHYYCGAWYKPRLRRVIVSPGLRNNFTTSLRLCGESVVYRRERREGTASGLIEWGALSFGSTRS